MTGLERNADVVHLTSYAPLFAHVDGWQWTPDLIWFDNLTSFGTANYHVQKLFANNRGTHVVPVTERGAPLTGQHQLYASAALDKNTGELILKIVNATSGQQQTDIAVTGVRRLGTATMTTLASERLSDMNSITEPDRISPEKKPLKTGGRKVSLILPPYSLTVARIKTL